VLNLPTTSAILQLVTGSAVNAIQVHASWIDLIGTTVTPGVTAIPAITAATVTTIVPAPAAGVDRNVKFISVVNTSGSSCFVIVQRVDGAIVTQLFPTTLGPGWILQYNTDGDGFVVYDNTGKIQVSGPSINIGGVAIAAGTQTATSGTALFANSNGITFGMSNSSVVTASYAFNLSAGTTSANLSAVTFSNSNGVSFGLNAGTVTASAAMGTVSVFSQDADFVTHFPILQAALSLQKVSLAMNLSATCAALIAAVSGFSSRTDAITIGHAVYTMSAGTANLASSASRLLSWTTGSQTAVSSEYGGASGTRYRTLGVDYSMTAGDYLFAWSISTANGATFDAFGRAGLNLVGTFDGIETTTFLNGTSVAPVGAFPMTIGATDTGYARTGFSAVLQPGIILFGS
jgi:hypothetical protein